MEKGTVSASLSVPEHIERPPYAQDGVDPMSGQTYSKFDLKSDAFVKMKDSCKHARDILTFAGELVKPGVTTDEIDRKVHEFIIKQDIYPSPFNYRGFPKSLCSSINEVMCHGIPDDRELMEGDIVNLDVSCYVNGFHGDTSRTFNVGNVSENAGKINEFAKKCLYDAIDVCGPNVPINAIGKSVADACKENGYETSKTFCGHGIGSTFHMLPYVLHFETNDPFVLVPGLVFTIEPIICEGTQNHLVWEDGWTIVTSDGGLSAQHEHTLVVTDNGVEILTA